MSEMRIGPEEPPFPTGRRAWEEVERPMPRDSTLRDMYPPSRDTEPRVYPPLRVWEEVKSPVAESWLNSPPAEPEEEEGPGIETLSMIGFK